MRYRTGIKYQLVEPVDVETGIRSEAARISIPGLVEPLVLTGYGLLRIPAGYCWDGPSGPTLDTKDGMRASLAHDALYMLMRAGHLSIETRGDVDRLFYRTLVDAGMSKARALEWYEGVCMFAAPSADPRKPAWTEDEAP